jgi:hypothetical protein
MIGDVAFAPFHTPDISLLPEAIFSKNFGLKIEDVLPSKEKVFWYNESSVFSAPIWSQLANSRISIESACIADDAMNHKFSILGSNQVVMDYGFCAPGFHGHHYHNPPGDRAASENRERMAGLITKWVEFTRGWQDVKAFLVDYEPIDWHVDLKSGYRFPQGLWHRKVPRIKGKGVDIKAPWCLSRFQHAPLMAIRGGNDDSYRNEFMRQVIDWISANPCGWGVNWACPMEVAIRAANWLWTIGVFEIEKRFPFWFVCLLANSLSEHARFIESNLEFSDGYGGNHYLANLLGLLFIATALPEAYQSDSWLMYALQEMEDQIEKTVNPDGSYVEGSVFYQALVTEMYLHGTMLAAAIPAQRREVLIQKQREGRLCFVKGAGLNPRVSSFDLRSEAIFSRAFFDRLCLMIDFLQEIRGPDGVLPQFGDNDSTEFIIHPLRTPVDVRKGSLYIRDVHYPGKVGHSGITQGFLHNLSAQKRHNSHMKYYENGGLVVFRWPPFFLVVNIGHNIGPFGGHSHSDLFSFELWVRESPLFVDPGTYIYGALPELRNSFRSCSAHNTLCVDGLQHFDMPSDLSGLFVAKQRAEPVVQEINAHGITMRHSAFLGRNHARRFSYQDGVICIEDEIAVEESQVIFRYKPIFMPGICR